MSILKNQLQNAKSEANSTQTQLKHKIRELENDVRRYRNLSPSNSEAVPVVCTSQDLSLWDPQQLLMIPLPAIGDCTAILEQIDADDEVDVQVVDPELRGEVTKANDELREKMRELEHLIARFGSQQQLLSAGGATACSMLLEMLSQEVNQLKQAASRASMLSGSTAMRLQAALLNERRISKARKEALGAKDKEVEACHGELQDLTKHMASLSHDLSKLSGRMKMQKTESMMHKENADELQRALRHKSNAMEHKDDEIRILREKLDDAAVTNAKTRAELMRLQQETNGWELRRNELERDLEATTTELCEERALRRREQESRDVARSEFAEIEYERDRFADDLENARLKIGKCSVFI